MSLPAAATAVVKSVLSKSCGVIALDAYIGNTDRNQRNALFGANASEPRNSGFIFIDHGHTLNMNNRWANNQWQQVSVPSMPSILRGCADQGILHRTIEQIENLADQSIEGIVNRIPDDYIGPDHRSIVLEGLKGRRGLIRGALAPTFGV